MVEASFVLTLLQTVSIMVGIAYYILNIDNNRKNQELALKNQEHVLKSRNATVFHNVIGQFLTNQQGIRNIQIVEDNKFTTPQEYSELWKLEQL